MPPLAGITPTEQRRLAWHLADDFGERTCAQQAEILDWVRTVVISGSTDFRRHHAEASKICYSLRFPSLTGRKPQTQRQRRMGETDLVIEEDDTDRMVGSIEAPPR